MKTIVRGLFVIALLLAGAAAARGSTPTVTAPGAGAGAGEMSALRERLLAPDTATRWAALEELWDRSPSEATPVLIGWLRDPALRPEAMIILGRIGAREAAPALIECLQDADTLVRRNVVAILRTVGAREAIPALIESLRDPDALVRVNAAITLGEFGARAAVPTLIAKLQDSDDRVRGNVAGALGEIGDLAAVAPLRECLHDPVDSVRRSAVVALGRMIAREAAPALIARLRDPDAEVRYLTIAALSRMDAPEAIPELIVCLHDSDATVRQNAIGLLSLLQAHQADTAIIECLRDASAAVRANAATALWRLNVRAANPELVACLRDRDAKVRDNASGALGAMQAREAIPALIGCLRETAPEVRRLAILVLGNLKAQDAVPALLSGLNDPDSGLRCTTITALASIGVRAAVPALVGCLRDSDPEVRRGVADALRDLQAVEAIPALIEYLDDPDSDARVRAIGILRDLNARAAVPALVACLHDPETTVWQLAMKVLAELDAPTAEPALLACLRDPSTAVRGEALLRLRDIGTRDATPAVASCLLDADAMVRGNALLALAKLGAREQRGAILACLRDPDSEVRANAVKALAGLGPEEAVPELLACLNDPSAAVRSSAALALADVGGSAVIPALIAFLHESDTTRRWSVGDDVGSCESPFAWRWAIVDKYLLTRRWNVAYQMGESGGPEAVPAFLACLQDTDAGVRRCAALALGRSGSAVAIPPLIGRLRDDDADVRGVAAEALGFLDATPAVPELTACLQDTEAYVRMAAAFALGKLRERAAVPALVECLRDRNRDVRRYAAWALGKMNAGEAAAALRDCLKDSETGVRAAAAEALGRVGDSVAIPALIEGLKDWHWWVRREAIDALWRLRARAAIPALIVCLQDPKDLVQDDAADVLGRWWPSEAAPELLAYYASAYSVGPAASLVRFGEHYFDLSPTLPFIVNSLGDTRLVAYLADETGALRVKVAIAAGWMKQYYDRELYAASRDYARLALRLARALDKRAYQVRALWQLGEIALQEDDAGEAVRFLTEADSLTCRMTLAEREDLPFADARNRLRLAQAQYLTGPRAYETAEQAVLQALDALGVDRELRGELKAGDDTAVRLTKWLIQKQKHDDRDDFRYLLAECYVLLGEINYADLKATSQVAQAVLAGESPRTARERAIRRRNDQMRIKLLLAEGKPEAAQQLMEEMNLGNLNSLYWELKPEHQNPVLRGAQEQIQANERQIAELQGRLARVAGPGAQAGTNDQQQQIIREIEALERGAREYKEALLAAGSEYQDLGMVLNVSARGNDLRELQMQLPDTVAIVQYVYDRDNLYVFLARRDRVRGKIVALPADEEGHRLNLDRAVAGFLERCFVRFQAGGSAQRDLIAHLRAGEDTWGCEEMVEARERGNELYRCLLAPLEDDLAGVTTLGIIPYGMLNKLPFAALYRDDGAGGGEFLIERYALFHAQSAGQLSVRSLRDFRGLLDRSRFVGLANADESLPAAERELAAISAAYFAGRSDTYLGAAARKEIVMTDTGEAILHFATHGRYAAARNEQSFLVLAPTGEEGRLSAREIWGLDLRGRCPLTVLSACETHRGETLAGNEVVSLLSGFLYAGSNAVVGTYWSVVDETTRRLMVEFYGELNAGNSVSGALRDGQAELLRGTGRLARGPVISFAHPFFWAPFVLYGDWR